MNDPTPPTLRQEIGEELLQNLLDILMRHCGETGENEGAVETLERKLRENAEMQEALKVSELVMCGCKEKGQTGIHNGGCQAKIAEKVLSRLHS